MLFPGGKRTTNMGMAPIDLSESHLHPRCGKERGQDRTSPRRVVVTPGFSGSNLGPIQGSPSRSLFIQGNNSLPGMVLPHGTEGQLRPRCSVARMTNRVGVCFPLFSSDSSTTQESHCTVLLVANTGLPVVTTITSRSSVTSRWTNLAFKPNCPVIMGLVSAECVSQQLDKTVCETLSNARAPSTQANDSLRWRIFSDWCLGIKVNPVVCYVPLVLCIMQSQLAQGKAANTIKIYASAISAFHEWVNGLPLVQHPLVCQFLKGTHRFCPSRALRAPSWNLPLILNSQ